MPTRGRSPTVRSGSRRQRARRVSRSSSSIVREPARRSSGYLWGPGNSYLSRYFDPFPAKAQYTLRYSDQITLNPVAAATSHYHFRANSIFDPDRTGVGHQPYGHDTLQGIYKSYVVDKAVITLTPTQFGNTACTYGLRVAEGAGSGTFHQVREIKGTTLATTAVGARPIPISRTYSRANMWPIEKDSTAVFGNNPAADTEAIFDIFMQGPNQSTDPGSVDFMVNITYYVTCFELIQIPGS
ncbi:MAG: putative capsid protein [Cressdnaviricota sp.]|nr:MAG: putative capsid protein [Cressdnaviricota sp.]